MLGHSFPPALLLLRTTWSSGMPRAAAMASSVYAARSTLVKVLKASRMGR